MLKNTMYFNITNLTI